MRSLKEKLLDRDLFIEGLSLQLKVKDDSESGPHGEFQKRNIALYHETWVVASLYSVFVDLRE